jgi:acetolactate synthase-1/3 small subunit
LNRVVSLFRRRNYNIESLTVGRTEREGVSRLTIVMEADDDAARRIEANFYKLVNVLFIDDVTAQPNVTHDLALIKVRATPDARPNVLQLAEVFRGRAVDVGPETLIVEIAGTQDKIDGLVEVLKPFGIVEMVRTGVVAMRRGNATVQMPIASEVEEAAE